MNPFLPTFNVSMLASGAVALGIFLQFWLWREKSPNGYYWTGIALLLIGLAGFVIGPAFQNLIPASVAVPVSRGLQGLEIDDDGNAYVGDEIGRIQIFDRDANFIGSAVPDHAGGSYYFELGGDKEIVVHTARGNLIERFSRTGQYLGRSSYQDDEVNVDDFIEKPSWTVSNDAYSVTVRPLTNLVVTRNLENGDRHFAFPGALFLPFFLPMGLAWVLAGSGAALCYFNSPRPKTWLSKWRMGN